MSSVNVSSGSSDLGAAGGAGKPTYVMMLTLVATLGGLLFGYDTAVVNGAERSLVELYVAQIVDPAQHAYAVAMITQYKALLAIVLYIVFAIVCSQIIKLVGKTKGFITAGVLMAALTIWALMFMGKPIPTDTA